MKNKQVITMITLIIAIVGLSIGFAAFSNTLNISSSASVTPDANTFDVVFSSSSNSVATNSVVPTLNAAATSANINTTNATISGRTISNLSAEFTAPGQSVTYSGNLYVYNAGQLQAQLAGIVFNEAEENYGSYKKCTAATKDSNNQDIPLSEQATQSLVDAACTGIDISVVVGSSSASPEDLDKTLGNQIINSREGLPVSITISYNGAYVDGPMDVKIGSIQITATSAINSSLVNVNPWKNRGLTSSYVQFDKSYTAQNPIMPLNSITINHDGSLNLGGEIKSSDYIDGNIPSGIKVGSNYIIIYDSNNIAFEFINGQIIAHFALPEYTSFEDILDHDFAPQLISNNPSKTNVYVVSQE